ncbi:ATP-binding protein [Pseudomonas sp. G.S.17]|uniref:ATP-binding protein n=1 Tax=Pseudomonas sp. G.S.17 TaxID=3137451 RepID=UPI00311CDC53
MKLIKPNSSDGYKRIGAPEIDDNPLLAHLRLPPETDDDAFISLGLRPDFDPSDRNLPTSLRRLRVDKLRGFFVPTQTAHRNALIGISSQVFSGYMHRNPLTPQGQRKLIGRPADHSYRPTISFIAGHSGMGKSTLIDRILASIGHQVYQHVDFRGTPFPEQQILWLRRNVPEYCTVKTLCSSFGDYADNVLGQQLYKGIFSYTRISDRSYFINEIRKIITNHHVGLLVFDEFQNLSLMGVGAEKIIAFLVTLRDELGLPIVIIGTYGALGLLEKNMSTARRLAEGGFYDLERPTSADDDGWQQLCRVAWPYQWVREPQEFSSDICEALYSVSQGITGIMLSVYAAAQISAMQNGSEKVDADLISEVFRSQMKPLHSAIETLRVGSMLKGSRFEDVYRNFHPTADTPAGTDLNPASPLVDSHESRSARPQLPDAAEAKRKKRKNKNVSRPKLTLAEIESAVGASDVAKLTSIFKLPL